MRREPQIFSSRMLDMGFQLGVHNKEWRRYEFYKPIEGSRLFWVAQVDYDGRVKSHPGAIPAWCSFAFSATAVAHFLKATDFRYVKVASDQQLISEGILISAQEKARWEALAADTVLREMASTSPELLKAAEAAWKPALRLADAARSKIGTDRHESLRELTAEAERRGALTLIQRWVEYGSTKTAPHADNLYYLAALAVVCVWLQERSIDTQSWKIGDERFVEHAAHIVADGLIRDSLP
jgi:hypothetical protein